MKRIIFICSGNTCRSPMAKGLLFKELQDHGKQADWEIITAGIYALDGAAASQQAIKVMKEIGIDISDHRSRQVESTALKESDWIVTMTRSHSRYLKESYPELADKIFTLYGFAELDDQDVADPFGEDEDAYRRCREQISGILKRALEKKKLI